MRFAALTTIALVAPQLLTAQDSRSVAQAVNSITPKDIRHRIGVIAHDSMRGRYTPSPELDEVAQYVAGEFRRFGLKPGGDNGSYLQRYPLESWRYDTKTPAITVEGGPEWLLGTEVARYFGGLAPSGVTGPAKVVWGTGASQAALRPLELQGSIALVVTSLTDDDLGRTESQLVFGVYRQRPAAIIMITRRSDASWAGRLASQRNSFATSPGQQQQRVRRPPVLEVRDDMIAPILEQHGFDLAAARSSAGQPVQGRQLPDLGITVTVGRIRGTDTTAPNTVGILEGSDPTLKNEYIVFSAHMDHVGVGSAGQGDSIYNGADDDASGTIGVVELAEAFANLNPPPKRSLVFLTVSGEERGLWGSRHFATNPPVPIDQIVANLNIDMIGRNWTDTVVVIGKEHSDLGTTLHRVSREHPELNMAPIDDIWPQENFYGRSDHINFARRGVPILFFFNGTHEDYHQAGDHVEKIDAEKQSRIVKLIFYLGLELANAAERPKWDPESYQRIVTGGGS
ncbi:MAG: M20/M25/M40 family metallo-hydrolase [Gemmatimonadales bacterium]|nr:M20/M25/M40 family metallo-hydrolase [Gemmatimonadales bacterium]NIN50718.1 M20/M25/M40 family metallo-hydrolase [Gemmatimonadales bacterium]NIP08182.1 M20/M25/M40 family metallo-hydrolase [Gemmatimonadales bacterium]NIR01060.1 M20/M25/M40 family metallo-hydrolase [Gemmatimonadales bacterium]NIS65139.1 M20/M25/M40 family metallo-hydrolase [Gemmatimonadales bacterium]